VRGALHCGRMAEDEKDRLGEKLRNKERAEEDRFFAERDRAALAKLRAADAAEAQAAQGMRCPKDGTPLVATKLHGVTVEECPACRGMWIDAGELEQVAQRERDSWLGRYFFRTKA
jgi:hypothetical protein